MYHNHFSSFPKRPRNSHSFLVDAFCNIFLRVHHHPWGLAALNVKKLESV